MKSHLTAIVALSFLAGACSISPSTGASGSRSNAPASADVFLPPADPNTPMMIMHQGEGAFGGKSFTVSVYADGRVHYEPHYTTSMNDIFAGNKAKPAPTPTDRTITPDQLRALLDAFAKADFLNLKDRYQYAEDGCPTHAEDLPTIELTLNLRDKSKKIQHNLGCMEVNSGPPYPRSLHELEGTVKRVTLTPQ
ncbi:MAG: DUF6438 domain-containing protein [Pyrinomonadaceae bacterium]